MAPKKKANSKARLKKAALSFYPEPDKYAALKELSVHTRVPQQVYLREGLDLVLERHRLVDVEVKTLTRKPLRINAEVRMVKRNKKELRS